MTQTTFDFPLTDFEQITLEAQVSYKAATDKDIDRLLSCEKLKAQVRVMVNRWNDNRIKKGLRPYK
jgi:hypothetical protein